LANSCCAVGVEAPDADPDLELDEDPDSREISSGTYPRIGSK
jgi:hypothetical protein